MVHLQNRFSNYILNSRVSTLTVVICLLTLFFSMPPIDSAHKDSTWDAIFTQIKDPFSPIVAPAWSHNSKLTFRLFPVLIGKLFCLNKTGFMVSLFLAGFLSIRVAFSIFLRLLQDKYKAFILTLSFAFIYVGKCSFLEFRGIFDGYAILFLLASIFYKNTIIIYFSILFASFTDERALIASGFVFLYYFIFENEHSFHKNKYLFTICFSWICYFSLRYFLMIYFNFKISSGGISLAILASNFELFPITLFSLFEGFWLVIVIFYFKVFSVSKWYFMLFLCMLFLQLIPSYLVVDVSRSLVFGSILIFIAISYLARYLPTLFSTNFCLIILGICFIYPSYVVGGDHIIWIKPVFLEILFRYFTNS